MSKNVKRSFFGLLKCPVKCCFCSDEGGKKRINLLSKPELCYGIATGGIGRVRAGVIWGDNAAGLVLLDKRPLACNFKEVNLDVDFNKPVERGFLVLPCMLL